tara:strand:- start:197 stop:589 length:393 start_codon:yes stop_codon:yes gene_type:complete
MGESNSAKLAAVKAQESSGEETSATTIGSQSPLERHLGLIKVMAIIMAVLIVAVLVIIVVTIYSRLTATNVAKNIQENELIIPAGSRISSASQAKGGQMLLLIEDTTGQQLWQIDPSGKIRRKTQVIQSP